MAPPLPHEQSTTAPPPPSPELKYEKYADEDKYDHYLTLSVSEITAASPTPTPPPRRRRQHMAPPPKTNNPSGRQPRAPAVPIAKSTPLPATVVVQDYEVTVSDLKKFCWRVSLFYACDHAVVPDAPGEMVPPGLGGCTVPIGQQLGGCQMDRSAAGTAAAGRGAGGGGLVVEVNKHHLHACINKYSVISIERVVQGQCAGCAERDGWMTGEGRIVDDGWLSIDDLACMD